jgi:hypothetical protein
MRRQTGSSWATASSGSKAQSIQSAHQIRQSARPGGLPRSRDARLSQKCLEGTREQNFFGRIDKIRQIAGDNTSINVLINQLVICLSDKEMSGHCGALRFPLKKWRYISELN